MTSPPGRIVRELVANSLDEMPPSSMPSGADAMRLLERIAIGGIKFPSSLIMLSKVMFTLEGLLGDIVGSNTGMDSLWRVMSPSIGLPIDPRPVSAWDARLAHTAVQRWLYASRLWVQWEQAMLKRFLTPKSAATAEQVRVNRTLRRHDLVLTNRSASPLLHLVANLLWRLISDPIRDVSASTNLRTPSPVRLAIGTSQDGDINSRVSRRIEVNVHLLAHHIE